MEDVESLLPELDVEDMPDIFWHIEVRTINGYTNYLKTK